MSKWYERLTEVRSSKGLSQQDLANELDVHLSAINRYEKGRGALALPNKFKIKLFKVFSKEEIDYIEYGGTISKKHSISQSGTNNSQIVGNGNIQTGLKPYDANNADDRRILQEAYEQMREEDMSVLDQEILEMLKFAPEAFKKNILAKLQEFKKMSEL